MADAYDFSFQPPSARELVAVGAAGGIGYVSADPRKNWTRARIDEFHKLGLGTAVVHENTTDWRSWDGALANRLADALGMPDDRPIFYAVDAQVPTSAYGAISNALRAQPGRPRGIYGGKGLGHFCLRDGSATHAWATNATSFDNGDHDHTGIALQQLYNQSPVPGTDRNIVLLPDWGQWPHSQPQPPEEDVTKPGQMVTPKDPNHPNHGEIVFVADGEAVGVHVPSPHIVELYRFLGVGGPVELESEWFDALAILPNGHLKV